MFTQCPDCHSIFPIGAEGLSVSAGNVRCGCCGVVFFAVESLCENLDDDGQIPTCFHSDRPPTLETADADDRLMDDLFWQANAAPPANLENEEDDEDDDLPLPTDLGGADDARFSVAQRARQMTRKQPGIWVAWSGFLALLMLAQWFWQNHDQLARAPRWEPWVNRFCLVLNCRIDLPRDLDKIRLVSRDIRSHPSVSDALMISATMQNQADFAQPYPIVEISLADLNGRTIGQRRFGPDEYLESGAGAVLAPNHLLPVVFEIVDPGQQAVAFEFVFR